MHGLPLPQLSKLIDVYVSDNVIAFLGFPQPYITVGFMLYTAWVVGGWNLLP